MIEAPDEMPIQAACTGVEGMRNLTAIEELRRAAQITQGALRRFLRAIEFQRHIVREHSLMVANEGMRHGEQIGGDVRIHRPFRAGMRRHRQIQPHAFMRRHKMVMGNDIDEQMAGVTQSDGARL